MGALPDWLPERLRDTPYVAARHPGAAGVAGSGDVAAGANCQLYACAVLGLHGLRVPLLRSSELWADTAATLRVDTPRPLDLVLFDAGADPNRPEGWGAHVGIHVADDTVLHLCAEAGRPEAWTYREFAAHARYARLLGAKRVTRTAA